MFIRGAMFIQGGTFIPDSRVCSKFMKPTVTDLHATCMIVHNNISANNSPLNSQWDNFMKIHLQKKIIAAAIVHAIMIEILHKCV